MKKLIALLAALTLLVAFAPACGGKKTTADQEGGKSTKKSRAEKKREAREAKEAKSKGAEESKETAKEPKTAVVDGPTVKGGTLYVIVERNIKSDMTEKETKNRNQTGEWMEADLTGQLTRAGFDVQVIQNRSHRKGGNLLVVSITKYNPGSTAARMFVGYGAGAASMNIHYELFGSASSPVLADDEGVGSSQDWRNVIHRLDQRVTKAVSNKLGK